MSLNLGFDYVKFLESDTNVSQSDIDNLRECLIRKDPTKNGIVPKDLTDQQLLLFFHSCKYSMADTMECIKNFYETKADASDIFDELTLESQEDRIMLSTVERCYLPIKTKEGDSILIGRLFDSNPSNYYHVADFRVGLMTIESCFYDHGPSNGMIVINDMKLSKLGHMTRMNLSAAKNFFFFIQHALPLKIKKVHMLNAPPFYNIFLSLVKPFLKRELFEMIQIHPSYTDLSMYTEKLLPAEYLPSDYGGTLPSLEVLNKQNTEKLRSLLPYFRAEEKQRKNALNKCTIKVTKKKESLLNQVQYEID